MRPGWGLIGLGALLLGFAFIANAARNPNGALGKTGFGEWAQRRGPVPTKPTRQTDNGSQVFLFSLIGAGLSFAGGIAMMRKGNNGGWDM